MKRRDFIRRGAVGAGVAGSLGILLPLAASESDPQSPSTESGGNLSADYLRRVRQDELLPKPPMA